MYEDPGSRWRQGSAPSGVPGTPAPPGISAPPGSFGGYQQPVPALPGGFVAPAPGGRVPGPDGRYAVPPHRMSGLFPSTPGRPTFREQYPVRAGSVAAGLAGAAGWLLAFGLLGRDLVGYAWATIVAGAVAWVTALLLARYGDRGVAAGIAIATALGLSIVTTAVAVRWTMSNDWPLW